MLSRQGMNTPSGRIVVMTMKMTLVKMVRGYPACPFSPSQSVQEPSFPPSPSPANITTVIIITKIFKINKTVILINIIRAHLRNNLHISPPHL